MNSNISKILAKSFFIFFFILNMIGIICCDGKATRQDLKNAVSIGQTLRNNKSSSSTNFKHDPPGQSELENSYDVQKHTLKPGETLQDLAVQYGTDWQSIQQANGLKNLTELKPGQVILIPVKKTDQR